MSNFVVFAQPSFDPNEYANAILAGEPYPPQSGKTKPAKSASFEPASEDVSVAISKLTFSIDDVEKQVKNVVTTHHEELLVQAAGVTELEGSLSSVSNGLNELDLSLEKLRLKIRVPYQTLQTHVSNLERLQQASDILRRMSRFVILTRRLEIQLAEMNKGEASDTADTPKSKNDADRPLSTLTHTDSALGNADEDEKERTISKAALTVAELTALLDNGPTDQRADTEEESNTGKRVSLTSIKAVAAHLSYIDAARARITTDMETMVITGLTTLNQSLLASSLQTAHNLRVLPELVQNLVTDLSDAVESRIRSAFDITRISKEVVAKDPASASPGVLYKSRVRTEPTNVTAPQWTAALWNSLESLIEEMADCCVKVLENKPSAIFWASLGRSLEKQARDSAKGSSFLQQALSSGYPRLLRLFQSFFSKIAVETDTVYTQAQQSPETVIVLRALSNFESLYLSRSSNRLNEAIGQAFSGGTRSPPGMAEGINIARTVANELDSAKFDPLLVRSVAKYITRSMELFLSRADSITTRERSAVTLVGPAATAQQVVNGQLATCLYHSWYRLQKLQDEYPEGVMSILKPGITNILSAFEHIVDPLLAAIRREVGAIIAKLHRMDFGQTADPMSAMSGGPSPYMKDVAEKLSFIKEEILSLLNVPDVSRQWIISIVKYVINTFVLHASIAKPLSESGKLQLTSDMTELEFSLSAFMSDKTQTKRGVDWDSIGDDYRALRAMRQLLFLDNTMLASPKHTIGLPPLIVLHHILVRSPIPLPHTLHGWAEAEYVKWVNEHSEEEAWTLVESDLTHWEKMTEVEDGDPAAAAEYIQLARAVLDNAAGRPGA
ncbi:Golgi transport complex subunit 5-domain-containing protein [Sparassis latifolia]